MRRSWMLGGMAMLALATSLPAATRQGSATVDPARDGAFPAHNQQLLVPSHGVGMNALLFAAAGNGPHHTVILMHGLPGNERNLDLAQAIRRAGWDVLTFTYRGAWGSPGDFSVSNAMEDTRAALNFARSPDAARLGIDSRHIVLAGHSMGGATAAMAAAADGKVDGLVLIDAWNIAADARRTTKAQLVAGFDDFGNALRGASPATVADEILARGREWDMAAVAPRLSRMPILSVTARYGGAADNRPVTAALRKAGNTRVTAVELNSDHSFADHRIALSQTVVGWLSRLR